MKCPICGHKTTTAKKDWQYTESGFDNVVLEDITVHTCVECGEEMPVIKKMPELHKLIAYSIAKAPTALTGSMFRFLRKQLGLSATATAKLLGVTKVTVSRWENDASTIGSTNDKLIRMIYLQSMQEECGKVFKDTVKDVTATAREKKPEPITVSKGLYKKLCAGTRVV